MKTDSENRRIVARILQGYLLGDNATVRGKLGRLNVGDDSEVDI